MAIFNSYVKLPEGNSWLLRCPTALPKKAHKMCPCAVVFYAVKNRGDGLTDVTRDFITPKTWKGHLQN